MTAITSNGTGGGNWSATATWTGAAVPIEDDTVIIQNGDTITIDQDITIGADTTTPAIDVVSGGKLEVLHTVAADYTLTCKGDLKTSSGGTIELGTVANPIPAARKFTVKLNYSTALAEGKYGFINNGNMILQGASKTPYTLLTSDLSATGAVWAVGDTTGWEVGDKVAIASTTRTYAQHEQEVIQTVDSGTQITCVAGVTYAHSGTSPTQAEVINLTRNIVITSYNTSYRGYVYCPVGSTSNVDYVEFYMIGYNATYKHGIELRATGIGDTNFAYCSVWGKAASNSPFYLYQCDNGIINNCVIYNTDEQFYMSSGCDDNVISNIIIIGITDYGMQSSDLDNTLSDISINSCSSYGIYFSHSGGRIKSASGFNIHSNGGAGIFFYYSSGTINNILCWRNNSHGIYLRSADIETNNLELFGNVLNVYNDSSIIYGSEWDLNSDTTFLTSYGIRVDYFGVLNISNLRSGVVTGIKTAQTYDIYTNSPYLDCVLINPILNGSSGNVLNARTMKQDSYIQVEDLNQNVYADKAWYRNGIVVRDSSTKKYGSYATRFDYQYNNAEWLEYETSIPVKDGEQIVVSAWLRKNASYTDTNRPKVIISGQGITEDSAQMSDVTDTWDRVTVSGTPTRTGLAKLTISTYLVNAGASAWVDFQKTDILSGVLNTIEGDFWANGHIAEVFMDTGSITAAEFWKTMTADVNSTGSFAKLFKDYIDAAISGRAPANEYDTEMAYIPSNLGDVPTDTELNSAHGSGVWTPVDTSLLALETTSQSIKEKTDTIDWTQITSLIDEIGGKWEIVSNQMIFYKSDNTTEVMRFDLFDSGGNPTMQDVFKRERVP